MREVQCDSVHKLQAELRVEQAKPVLKEQEGCGEDTESKMNSLLVIYLSLWSQIYLSFVYLSLES